MIFEEVSGVTKNDYALISFFLQVGKLSWNMKEIYGGQT